MIKKPKKKAANDVVFEEVQVSKQYLSSLVSQNESLRAELFILKSQPKSLEMSFPGKPVLSSTSIFLLPVSKEDEQKYTAELLNLMSKFHVGRITDASLFYSL